MMKMMILAPRRIGMSHAEFRAYVTGVHGPLVKSVSEVAADIRHYHYNFPVQEARDLAFDHPMAARLDIVTQGWFDSLDAQRRNMKHPRYLEIIRPDEGRFANEAGAVMHYTREITFVNDAALLPRFKAFYFRRRRAGLTRDAFQSRWRASYASALVSNTAFGACCGKYVQNHTLPESDHPDGFATKYFDVIDELFLDKPEAIVSLREDSASFAAIRSAEDELLEPGSTQCFIAETLLNIP